MSARKKFGEGKSIVLIISRHSGLNDIFIKAFKHHGFKVFSCQYKPYKYKNNAEKVTNFFRRTFLNDTGYKNRQQINEVSRLLKADIEQYQQAIDYALFIRPDRFPIELIEYVKKSCNKCIGYQWDGLEVFPEVFNFIELFDDFFVFDSNDKQNFPQYRLRLTNNFYFDIDDNSVESNQSADSKHTVYFVGTHIANRVNAINIFTDVAKDVGLDINFFLGNALKSKSSYRNAENINFIEKRISYETNLALAKQADILIDFVNEVHAGLSFRIFEAIFYQKKVITTNTDIVHYDLYNEHNIFIWDGNTLDKEALITFLEHSYSPLPQSIVKKYSFKNWASYMLGIEPYQSFDK